MCHIARQDHDRDTAPAERVLDRDAQQARQLLRLADQLAVVTALREQSLGMRLLEEPRPDLSARNVGSERQHRRTAAMRVVETLDEVRVARAAATGANREPPAELRLRPGRERGRLLVVDVDPLDAIGSTHRVDYGIEAIADEPIDPFDLSLQQDLDELIRNRARALWYHGLLAQSSGSDLACGSRAALAPPGSPLDGGHQFAQVGSVVT